MGFFDLFKKKNEWEPRKNTQPVSPEPVSALVTDQPQNNNYTQSNTYNNNSWGVVRPTVLRTADINNVQIPSGLKKRPTPSTTELIKIVEEPSEEDK